jgi:DNA-binding FrmR family transcriptional regulator
MLAMTPRVKQDALFRLKSILGHVHGVIRMLEREEYCIDVIKQVAAIEVALKKVNAVLLQNHLDTCVTVAVNEKIPAVRSRVVRELLEIFQTESRVSGLFNRSSLNKNRKLKGKAYGKRSGLQHAG